jgi:shikimate dehydrogenase
MKKFGLIGFPLKHSFSKRYFTEKFEKEGRKDCHYELFEIDQVDKIKQVLAGNPELVGLNVTIPYKEQIIPFLDELEPGCQAIGAVNTVKVKGNKLVGYNTDYIGFKQSLSDWLPKAPVKALVLGTGGASRAVKQALSDLSIPFLMVSRNKSGDQVVSYTELNDFREILDTHHLIINTTPLGTYPDTEEMPPLPLSFLSEKHMIYDLVYNPEKTLLMRTVENAGGLVKNGLEMLHLQAEASWQIWNRTN